MKIYTYILIIILAFALNSCIVVKNEEVDDVAPLVKLSPKPEIPMSDLQVRSSKGDMIAFLPEGWFFIDTEEASSADVFAVAVNPDYTLSAVFSVIRKTDKIDELVVREGLLGLARTALGRHERKTAGGVKLSGKYAEVEMGPQKFCKFEFTSTKGGLRTRVVVFTSSFDRYYQFSLMPMNITGKPHPATAQIDRIFNSILATVEY
jgi:hypothetical protein